MKINQIIEAIKTPCLTPGAVYHTKVTDSMVIISVDLPKDLDLNKEESKELESNLHNAVEMVLARYFE